VFLNSFHLFAIIASVTIILFVSCKTDDTHKLAEEGDPMAQYELGIMYQNGEGVPQNYSKAVKWFRKAAEQGDSSAQYRLGLKYNVGHGVPQDYSEAVKWFRKSAEKGDAAAQLSLARIYDKGHGVQQNDILAFMWSNLAVGGGLERAKTQRDIIRQSMSKEQITEAERLSKEWIKTRNEKQ
jgi:hypothetical protein